MEASWNSDDMRVPCAALGSPAAPTADECPVGAAPRAAMVLAEADGRGTPAAGERVQPTLAEIFEAHAAFVGRALRCLGVAERDLSDACQDVFLVVHRKLPGFEGRSSIRTWLYGICLRQARAARRHRSRRREDPVPEPPESPAITDCATPYEDCERGRALEVALSILADLDENKRAVFVLYEVEQLSMAEVAEAVGCPVQTAYARLYAARRHVRKKLKRHARRTGRTR